MLLSDNDKLAFYIDVVNEFVQYLKLNEATTFTTALNSCYSIYFVRRMLVY